MQDGTVVIELELLSYTKSMPTAIFSNIGTLISLVNEARYIYIDIVLDDNGIFNLWLVDNQINNCSNLSLLRFKYNFVQRFSKSCIITLVYSFQTCFSQG